MYTCPPSNCQGPELYYEKQWHGVQCMANQFWIRWKQWDIKKKKWNILQRNMQVGDVVFLHDDNLPKKAASKNCKSIPK